MDLRTLFLSLIQSITEFLPVSSSGHLILTRTVFGWQEEQGIVLDIALHIGTLLAVCVYFYKDLKEMLISLFKRGEQRRLIGLLAVATVPVLLIGFFFAGRIEQLFRDPYIICIMLMVFGIFLWLTDKDSASDNSMKKMTFKDALFIGMAQCLALIPGVSRSGVTMTAARLRKINRPDAAHFSMLLSVPTIGAVGAWLMLKLCIENQLDKLNAQFFQGIIFSFIGGLMVICFLMNFVKKNSFFAFMIYRFILGIVILIFLFFN